MQKKRILITASTFPRYKGDACPGFILDFCKSLAASDDFECLVLSPHSEKAQTSELMEGIQVKRYKYFFPYSLEKLSGNGIMSFLKKNSLFFIVIPFFLFFQFISTFITIKQFKPDIIIAHWLIPQGLIAAIVKLFLPDIKILTVSLGGDAALIKNNFFANLSGKFTVKQANKVVAVSGFIKNILIKELKINSFIPVIPMAIDEKLFKTQNSTEKTKINKNILFLGRLVEKKGVKYLIEAMPLVIKNHSDAILHIIGDGLLKNELVIQAKNLNIEKNIIFRGAIEYAKLPEVFASTLIFVAPSINEKDDLEGLPTVLAISAAAKTPIITTDAGGITDLIQNYTTGIIVEQRNSVQLAEKIIELIENGQLRKELADNAYNKLLTDFTLDKTGEKYRNLIFECINGA
ncbi:MAG TPA: glycosyltransferase [Candidatus Gastranaerophilales bacterium]|nr:glycosyltransferase [Candidatus Gastranaerophilales bacterium]